MFICFFFSSRRRHTRCSRDWSSDVCSSDLGPAHPAEITTYVRGARPTVNRHLRKLVEAGQIVREGTGPATTYRYKQPASTEQRATEGALPKDTARVTASPPWSVAAREIRARLEAPMGTRAPVSYQRKFVDDYRPNHSSLLPAALADGLLAEGRMQGQQPA